MFKNIVKDHPNTYFTIKKNIGGFNYFALFEYYSRREFQAVPIEIETNRNEVYDFKNGLNTDLVANKIKNALLNEFKDITQEHRISIIPASTKLKNAKRFYKFCEILSKELVIVNSYESIVLAQDHEPTKGDANKNILEYLKFNQSYIGGKMFLFDDIKTTGRSFVQCADMLMKLGAEDVTGIFIGETYSTYKNGYPKWYNEYKNYSDSTSKFLDDLFKKKP